MKTEDLKVADTGNSRRKGRWSRTGEGLSLFSKNRESIPVRFNAEPESVEVDLTRSALVIIDMQNDFLHKDGWFATCKGIDVTPLSQPIDKINALSEAFRKCGTPVLHVNWGVNNTLSGLPANLIDKASDCGRIPAYGDQLLSHEILVSGSWGADSIGEIDVAPTDVVIRKSRFSGFHNSELDQVLRDNEITCLFLTGVNIDRCVFATLIDGSYLGYDSILIEDACATVSPEYVSEAILYLTRLLYGFTAKSADILTALAALPSITNPKKGIQQ